MDYGWILLVAGIFIGWLTKVPFLIEYYKKIKRNKELMNDLYENIVKLLNTKENEEKVG